MFNAWVGDGLICSYLLMTACINVFFSGQHFLDNRFFLFQVLKLYAWEESFLSQVSQIRKKELHQLKNAAYLNASFAFSFTCAPFMVRIMSIRPQVTEQNVFPLCICYKSNFSSVEIF